MTKWDKSDMALFRLEISFTVAIHDKDSLDDAKEELAQRIMSGFYDWTPCHADFFEAQGRPVIERPRVELINLPDMEREKRIQRAYERKWKNLDYE